MTDINARFEELRAELERQNAMLRAAIGRQRRHLEGLDPDDGLTGVREPGRRDGPSPRTDTIAAPLPPPHYHLDVIGCPGGKVTIESKE
jgi:hypothetical protein